MQCLYFEAPKYLFFSTEVAPLLYYTHIPTFFVALFIGVFVFLKNRKSLESRLLLSLNLLFCILIVCNLFLWTSINVNLITFLWPLAQVVYIIVPIVSLYLFYVFLGKRLPPVSYRIIWISFIAGALAIVYSPLNIEYFDLINCELITVDFIFNYQNAIFGILLAWLLIVGVIRVKKAQTVSERRQIALFLFGTFFFLALLITTWQIAGRLGYFALEQYGLFGILVFIAVLAYLIVRYRAFNTSLFGTTVLLSAQGVIMVSLLFIQDISYIYAIIAASLIIFLVLAIIVVRSVKKEIKQREQIELLAQDLKKTNDNLEHANSRLKELDRQKTEFVSFATHQLRSPLTAMKGYCSLILEGDYGQISDDLRGAIQKMFESSKTLAVVVNDYLNISRIELGTMKYEFTPTDIKQFIERSIEEVRPTIDGAGVSFSFTVDARAKYTANIDSDKFKQVILNIIDNAIKYAPRGVITLSLSKDTTRNVIRISLSDNGIGMSPETISKLFMKFSRAENATKVNIRGTGLGLFVAREIVVAHGGKMWAESDGEGNGSRFYVEIPALS